MSGTEFAPIRTARLTLRLRGPGDFALQWALAQDYELVRWTASWPWPADAAFTRSRTDTPIPAELGRMCVVEQEGCGLGIISVIGGELGYMFARETWGRGIASEAAGALVDHMFAARPGLEDIRAGVFDGNAASMRVLEKTGFVQTGRSQVMCRAMGCALDGTDYQLTRAGREAARAAAAGGSAAPTGERVQGN